MSLKINKLKRSIIIKSISSLNIGENIVEISVTQSDTINKISVNSKEATQLGQTLLKLANPRIVNGWNEEEKVKPANVRPLDRSETVIVKMKDGDVNLGIYYYDLDQWIMTGCAGVPEKWMYVPTDTI